MSPKEWCQLLRPGRRQRQLARAVIRPAIYVFDDAFSTPDVHTDAKSHASLRQVSGDTAIIVTVSNAAQPDQVIVVDNGKIVGTGAAQRCWPVPHLCRIRRLTIAEAPRSGVWEPRHQAHARKPAPNMRSHDFRIGLARLVARLAPQRRRASR